MNSTTMLASATARPRRAATGFTLIELLTVVAIIALLLAVLLPTLQRGRTAARIVRAHAELRGVAQALLLYQDDCRGQLPPARFSCAHRVAYELPVELGQGGYLPLTRRYTHTAAGMGHVEAIDMPDVFAPHQTYRYRAVGAAIMNEHTLLEPPNGASLWVPTDFPDVSEPNGRYWFDPAETPVRYAIWSIGPDPESPKFQTPGIPAGHVPIPRFFWCRGATDTGVLTHYQDRDGRLYMSD